MRAGLAALLLAASPAGAADHATLTARAVDTHVLPAVAALADPTATLADAAEAVCDGTTDLAARLAAYHAAFDAWMGASHLRFGPMERENRGFAIAFWPDPRAAGPRALSRLLAEEAPDLTLAPIAARGLFALEWLLADPAAEAGDPVRRCHLIAAVAADLATTAAAVDADWRTDYAARLRTAGTVGNMLYTTPEEATRTLYGALTGGLDATRDLRLAGPLGTEGRPRPRAAEAWRSGRSLRHVGLALDALEQLALALAPAPGTLPDAFAAARTALAAVPASLPEAVQTPEGRDAVATLIAALDRVRETVASEIGAPLSLTLGFNALDGD